VGWRADDGPLRAHFRALEDRPGRHMTVSPNPIIGQGLCHNHRRHHPYVARLPEGCGPGPMRTFHHSTGCASRPRTDSTASTTSSTRNTRRGSTRRSRAPAQWRQLGEYAHPALKSATRQCSAAMLGGGGSTGLAQKVSVNLSSERGESVLYLGRGAMQVSIHLIVAVVDAPRIRVGLDVPGHAYPRRRECL